MSDNYPQNVSKTRQNVNESGENFTDRDGFAQPSKCDLTPAQIRAMATKSLMRGAVHRLGLPPRQQAVALKAVDLTRFKNGVGSVFLFPSKIGASASSVRRLRKALEALSIWVSTGRTAARNVPVSPAFSHLTSPR
jgi:hypothetical protein